MGNAVCGALVTGAFDGDEVTGAFDGDEVTCALEGDEVTGAFVGDEVTGALEGDEVVGGAFVGAWVGPANTRHWSPRDPDPSIPAIGPVPGLFWMHRACAKALQSHGGDGS